MNFRELRAKADITIKRKDVSEATTFAQIKSQDNRAPTTKQFDDDAIKRWQQQRDERLQLLKKTQESEQATSSSS